jgi:hypothetical protein
MKQTGGELLIVRELFEINIVRRILTSAADPDDTKRELGRTREAK